MKLNTYQPWELLLMWDREEQLTEEQAIGHMLQNLVDLDKRQNQTERENMRQQREIEKLHKLVVEKDQMIKFLRGGVEAIEVRGSGNSQKGDVKAK